MLLDPDPDPQPCLIRISKTCEILFNNAYKLKVRYSTSTYDFWNGPKWYRNQTVCTAAFKNTQF